MDELTQACIKFLSPEAKKLTASITNNYRDVTVTLKMLERAKEPEYCVWDHVKQFKHGLVKSQIF